MRAALEPHSEEMPLPEDKLAIFQERARLKRPLFKADDKPDFFSDHDSYLHTKRVYKAIGVYMAIAKENEDDPEAEVTYVQIASIFNFDPRKPQLLAQKLPLPCTNPTIKTSKYVWKWHDIKQIVRRLVDSHVIKELATRL